MDTLITAEELQLLARPVSRHLDVMDVTKYIRECQDYYIVPAIGYERVKALCQPRLSEQNNILLNGGEYEHCGKLRYCDGIKSALAYFAYSKLLKQDGLVVTRSGAIQHNDNYGARDEKKMSKYDDAMNVAEMYLSNCLEYLKSINSCVQPARGTRARVKSVGE